MRLYSEVDGARAREVVADVATLAWLVLWGSLAWNLFGFLAGFAAAGRTIRTGGERIEQAGTHVGGAIAGVPLVGEGASGGVRAAFDGAAQPFIEVGNELERLLVVIAALLAVLVLAVVLVPWLSRYLPWRIRRLRLLATGHRAIRRTNAPRGAELDRILASRALHRLPYEELLSVSPDPLGDWVAGRYDRLARAELQSVGLVAR